MLWYGMVWYGMVWYGMPPRRREFEIDRLTGSEKQLLSSEAEELIYSTRGRP